MKKVSLIIVLALLLVSVTAAFAEGTPVDTIVGENQGGNLTCAEVGDFEFSSDRVNYTDGLFDAAFPNGITVSTDGTYVSWTSTFGIGAVIVKGGNAANVFYYDPQATFGSGLASPVNSSGKPAGLSNITFCWNPEPEPAQWCSPGYWRQDQHLDSWAVTGYSPTDNFAAEIGYTPKLSKLGLAAAASSDPSLWQVLQSPQWYGGEAFNAVGDLLSEAHPDINFTGERVEDSCPLN
jgi:hypothetical protein